VLAHIAEKSRVRETSNEVLQPATCSIREVEVVVRVVIVLTLAEAREDEVEGAWDPGDTEPHSKGEIANPSLDDEALEATVHEVEDPLLRGVRAMMEDHAASERGLLVPILLTVPRSPALLWHAETLTVGKSHVLGVSVVVGLKASSCSQKKNSEKCGHKCTSAVFRCTYLECPWFDQALLNINYNLYHPFI